MKTIIARALCVLSLVMLLLPFTYPPVGSARADEPLATGQGEWREQWAGGFGVLWDFAYSPDRAKLAVAGATIIHILDARTYECERQFFGHGRKVFSIAYSPDGTKVASASADSTVRIWDLDTGMLNRTFEVSDKIALSVAWSPDGDMIATGADDAHLKLWDVNTGDLLTDIKAHDDGVMAIDFSPDGSLIATGSGFSLYGSPGGAGAGSYNTSVKLWESSTGALECVFAEHEEGITCVKFSPDGTMLASASRDDTVMVWDVQDEYLTRTFEGHGGDVNDVSWSKDNTKLVSGSDDNTIKLWDLEHYGDEDEGEPDWLEEFTDNADVNAVEWSRDYTGIISGSDRAALKVWARGSEEPIEELGGHTNDINAIDCSPDSTKIVSGAADMTLRIWDAATGECLKTIDGLDDWVNDVAWSPDGKYIASCGDYYDPTVRIWDAETYQNTMTLVGHTYAIYGVGWSPDSKKVVSGSGDGTVRIWNVETGECELILKGHTNMVYTVDWSPDGKYILSGGGERTHHNVRIWDADTGLSLARLWAHDYEVYCVKWSDDGDKFVTCSWQNAKIWAWDGDEITFLVNIGFHSYLVWDADWARDDSVLVASSKEIIVWDVATGEALSVLKGHAGEWGNYPYVKGVVWLSDSKIASGAGDLTIRTWLPVLPIEADMETKLLSEGTTSLSINVVADDTAVSNANLKLYSDRGTLSEAAGETDNDGNFEVTYYAPSVEQNTTCTVTVAASKAGYSYGKIDIPITVYPLALVIEVDASSEISVEKSTTITIRVSNYIGPLANAEVALTTDSGTITPRTGMTNSSGELSVTFKAPRTATGDKSVITVRVSKSNYPSASRTATIKIRPRHQPFGGFIPGFELGWLLMGLAIAVLFKSRKPRKWPTKDIIYPQAISYLSVCGQFTSFIALGLEVWTKPIPSNYEGVTEALGNRLATLASFLRMGG